MGTLLGDSKYDRVGLPAGVGRRTCSARWSSLSKARAPTVQQLPASSWPSCSCLYGGDGDPRAQCGDQGLTRSGPSVLTLH